MNIFWLNNVHFAVEFFGAAVLVVAAWLSTDAYMLTRDRKLLLKVFGFGSVASWQLLHALDVVGESGLLAGIILLVVGLVFLLADLYIETPPARPKTFELVFVIPSVAGLLSRFFLGAGVLAALVALVAFKRVRAELNRPLVAYGVAFSLFAVSFFIGMAGTARLVPDALWYAEHAVRLAGFIALTVWIWQYLKPRLKEELLLIFVAMALMVTLAVTFTFSALLLTRLQSDASESLAANARVFTYTLERMGEELAAKSERVADDGGLADALQKNNFAALEDRAGALRQAVGVDFLTIADIEGTVLHRATYRLVRGESLRQDPAAEAALSGQTVWDLHAAMPEGLSVRAAAPIKTSDGKLVGIIEVGSLLDSAFLDGFKALTGLDITVYSAEVVYATTIAEAGSAARPVGVRLTDEAVKARVLGEGESYGGLVNFLGKPHVATYVPLVTRGAHTIGMAAASRPAVDITKAAIATNRLTLFTTLAIVLLLLVPAYLAVRKVMKEV
ncbi:MAG: cache domain-containing protein [bacterium]|nr:cache domain-containing protein [bacterium]